MTPDEIKELLRQSAAFLILNGLLAGRSQPFKKEQINPVTDTALEIVDIMFTKLAVTKAMEKK